MSASDLVDLRDRFKASDLVETKGEPSRRVVGGSNKLGAHVGRASNDREVPARGMLDGIVHSIVHALSSASVDCQRFAVHTLPLFHPARCQ